jgi:Flp pilus assembly protein TadG
MNRRKNEDGQAFVLMAFALVVMLGMAALVLDAGSWFRTDRRLQATADAAALAGVQELPQSRDAAIAAALAYANLNGGDVAVGDIKVTKTFNPDDTISVKAQKDEPGFFSKVLGVDEARVEAAAKARVDTPAGVRYVAPMVVSCGHKFIQNCNNNGRVPDFEADTELVFDKMGAPGAFGMLNLSKSSGTPGTSEEADWILRGFSGELYNNKEYRSDPGAKFASQEIRSALDQRLDPDAPPLLFPVFEKDKSLLEGGGQVTSYYVIGWIAFKLTSYEIRGNNAVLRGYFVEYIASGILSPTGSGSPNFGVKSIQLIE